MERFTTNDKGTIAEAKIAARAAELGFGVLVPMGERLRYDLALDDGSRVLRVQCKWATCKGDVIAVRATTSRLTPAGYVRTTYNSDEIDAVAAYCADVNRCYFIPAEALDGRGLVHLRLSPARNGQRAAVTMAADYEFGAIAQLGERLGGTQKVVGSSPTSSTSSAETVIGSHEFRNRVAWYLQRAAAGERFSITRHRKPHAALGPPP